MALLPDLAAAAIYAAVVFLVALGFLVVFVETIRPSRLIATIVACAALVASLVWLGEPGLGLLVLGIAGAFVGSQVFDWLTTRR